jgi:hypothetical protein
MRLGVTGLPIERKVCVAVPWPRSNEDVAAQPAELYWAAHESRYPSRPGDDVPDGNVYDSMEALVAGLGVGE